MSNIHGHSYSHKQLRSKEGLWVCVREDHGAQEMGQEGCPLVSINNTFHCSEEHKYNSCAWLFSPWAHEIGARKSWKHTGSGYKNLAQSGWKCSSRWNSQRLGQTSRNSVALKIAIIRSSLVAQQVKDLALSLLWLWLLLWHRFDPGPRNFYVLWGQAKNKCHNNQNKNKNKGKKTYDIGKGG